MNWTQETIDETLAEDSNREPITPKPWKLCKQSDTHDFWIPNVAGDDEWGGGMKLADGRLVAAAPDLLAACRLLIAGDIDGARRAAVDAVVAVETMEPSW